MDKWEKRVESAAAAFGTAEFIAVTLDEVVSFVAGLVNKFILLKSVAVLPELAVGKGWYSGVAVANPVPIKFSKS